MDEPAGKVAAPAARDEEALVRSAVDGDARARAALADRWRSRVYAWCRLALRDSDEAEDATQDTLVQVWRHIGDLHDPRAFPAWLYQTALSCCHRHRARRSRESLLPAERASELPSVTAPGGEPSPEAIAVARCEIDRMLRCLRPEERALLEMKYGEQMSSIEIGEALGTSDVAIRSRIHAAVLKLRGLLGVVPRR